MERTTFSLPEDLLRRLRAVATDRHTSMAALIREALEEHLLPEDYLRVREVCDQYAEADIGFVDAAVFAVVERLREKKLATLDRRHFGILRPRHVDSLELLPATRPEPFSVSFVKGLAENRR